MDPTGTKLRTSLVIAISGLVFGGVAAAGPKASAGKGPGKARCAEASTRWWGRPAKVQVAVVADSIAADLTELTNKKLMTELEGLRTLWSYADDIRDTLEGDLTELRRTKAGKKPLPIHPFEVDEKHRLEKELLKAGGDLPRVQRNQLLHGVLGLNGATPAQSRMYPSWICEKLDAHRSDVGVVVYLRDKGAVLKMVLAKPCMELGTRTVVIEPEGGEPGKAEAYVTALHDALLGLLDARYWAEIKVEGPKGSTVVLDGVTVGQLPLAGPLCTAPGRHTLHARHEEEGCAWKEGLEPGDGVWVVQPGSCERGLAAAAPARFYTWIAAGASVVLAGAAVASHFSATGLLHDAESMDSDRGGSISLREDARSAAIRANALYVAAGATAVAATVLFFTEGRGDRPGPGPDHGPKVGFVPAVGGGELVFTSTFP